MQSLRYSDGCIAEDDIEPDIYVNYIFLKKNESFGVREDVEFTEYTLIFYKDHLISDVLPNHEYVEPPEKHFHDGMNAHIHVVFLYEDDRKFLGQPKTGWKLQSVCYVSDGKKIEYTYKSLEQVK